MKYPTRKPRYTQIATASEFCKDVLVMSLQVKQKTTFSCLLEDQIDDIIRTVNKDQYDLNDNAKLLENTIESKARPDRPPDFFPFSRITTKKKDSFDNSSQFFSQSNKMTKNQEKSIENPRINNNDHFEKQMQNAEALQLKREPFSFKPSNNNDGPKPPKFAIQETNKIWQNTESDEISLVADLNNTVNPSAEIEDERVKRRFQQQGLTQEHLADQYYVEKGKRKSNGVKYGYIASKVHSDSFDASNNSLIYDKLENEIQKNLMNPIEIDIKSKNRILGSQSKNVDGMKLIKLKNAPNNTYTHQKREIKNPYDAIEVATTHPNFHKNTLLLVGPKSLQRISKNSNGKEIKKVDLNGFNTKDRINPHRRSDPPNKNAFGQSAIKQILKKEAGRIKKEIETIKSNLESYRITPDNNLIAPDPTERKAKSDKYNNLHTLIRNSLYHQ